MRETHGTMVGKGLVVGLVAARFNQTVVASLVEGANRALLQHGVGESDIELIWVPGAFEIPVAAAELLHRGGLDALIALGAVIRGETPHFEYVASAVAAGIAELGLRHRVATGFGVLTVDTVEQANSRAGGKLGNKGWEAATSALELASVLRQLRGEA
ncbi:MAG: 6,7-dimethyl-8-ribityllumazine synthase [Candidatus Dormibacteraeota bacterium]|nr:6,7-dimethyl-8-ribityllumazine synthase [Candidatus Dormibacteraeota bacterium]